MRIMNKSIIQRLLRTLPVVCFLFLSLQLSGAAQQERISVNLRDVPVTQFFKEIEQMTSFRFFYKDSQVENTPKVTILAENQTLTSVLDNVFSKLNLGYQITGNQIVVIQKENQPRGVTTVTGVVIDKTKVPLAGVAVIIPGTRRGVNTDEEGRFSIDVPAENYKILGFRMIGMDDLDLLLDRRTNYEVVMTENSLMLSDIVVTGIVDKRAESFTGSVSTISSKDLVRTGNKNIFESLKNIDPSIYIMDKPYRGIKS